MPGGSLSPKDTQRVLRSSNKVPFALEDSLFSDDSTLVGTEIELKTGKAVVK